MTQKETDTQIQRGKNHICFFARQRAFSTPSTKKQYTYIENDIYFIFFLHYYFHFESFFMAVHIYIYIYILPTVYILYIYIFIGIILF